GGGAARAVALEELRAQRDPRLLPDLANERAEWRRDLYARSACGGRLPACDGRPRRTRGWAFRRQARIRDVDLPARVRRQLEEQPAVRRHLLVRATARSSSALTWRAIPPTR